MSKMVPVNHAGMSDIQTVYGGTSSDGGTSLSEYYRGGTYVPINQLPSVHGAGPIPLLSNGIGQTISIGMFRGNRKAFQWVFNITEDRFTSFNLYNELIAVGWSGDIPVEVTINVYTGVYVVSQSTSIPTIDASANFDPASTLTLFNSGFIYGRGGRGGTAGVYPDTPGAKGQNGGTATHFNLRTKIYNYGDIAGGGGGGGGGPGILELFRSGATGYSKFGDQYRYKNKSSGAGGQPFGEVGLPQNYYSSFEFEKIPEMAAQQAAAPEYSGYPAVTIEKLEEMYNTPYKTIYNWEWPGSSGLAEKIRPSSLEDRGYTFFGNRSEFLGRPDWCFGGDGGSVGSSGNSGVTNIANLTWGRPHGESEYTLQFCTPPGEGGEAGYAILGGAMVSFVRYGRVLGKQDFNVFTNTSLVSVSQLLTTRLWEDRVFRDNLFPNLNNTIDWNKNYPNGYAFSYNPNTNLTNTRVEVAVAPPGSPIRLIKYSCIIDNTFEYSFVCLEGTVDDRIVNVVLNGVPVAYSEPNGALNKNTPLKSGTFNIPKGFSILEVWVRDDNGNSGTTYGNTHKIYLHVKAGQYFTQLVSPSEWYVKEINNL